MSHSSADSSFNPHGTTILAVRRNGAIAMGGDGQVTLGNTVMKGNARKVRRLDNDKVLAGFAGGTADAFTLFERFEGKLEKYGNLTRAAIELAKDPSGWIATCAASRRCCSWATRRSSSSSPATATSSSRSSRSPPSARAGRSRSPPRAPWCRTRNLDARSIVERSLNIAADICIYTNRNLVIDELK